MDKYEKLLSAVYFNDAETAIRLIETKDYPNNWLDNVLSMGIPIYYITQCYARLLSDDLWNEKAMPMILSMRKGCSKLLSYWKTKFNYPVEQELDYTSYTDLFFAAFSDDTDDTDDEVLLSSVQELLNEGYRQIDIDLYCATERFQYGEVERLLKLGADPEVDIEDCKAMSMISVECSFLSTIVVPKWEFFYEKKCLLPIKEQDLCDLIGWAAHEKMHDLLIRNVSF